MGKQIVEYLYYAKKETIENIEDTFRGILSKFSSDSQFKCDFECENLIFQCEITTYGDSLNVVYTYNKLGQIGIKEVRVFQRVLEEINIEVSKSKISHTTLLDTNSLFFSKKLLPYLHNYEWSMRKLIYLVAPAYFSDEWIEKSVPKQIISTIKSKQKGEYDAKNLLQSLDLYDIEEYLFGENYVKISGDGGEEVFRFKEYDSNGLIDFFSEGTYTLSKPYSLWEDVFNKYVDIKLEEIQLDMKLIREGRNSVSHNKEITEFVYLELQKKLKIYINLLDSAFKKILSSGIDNEELNDMADDFEGYIDNRLNRSDITGINNFTKGLTEQIERTTGINNFAKGLTEQIERTTGINNFAKGLAEQIERTIGINNFTKGLTEQISTQREIIEEQSLTEKDKLKNNIDDQDTKV